MNTTRNLRLLLLGGSVAVLAGLALSGCDRDNPGATASAPPNASANASNATNPVDPSAPALPADEAVAANAKADNDMEAMERHHQQAMDHAEMRAGHTKPEAPPQKDSPPPPMKDM